MAYIHFALGKALEDVGDYQRAFQHLLQGNALRRREITYDEADCQEMFRLIAELFDSELFDRFRGVGDPSPVPIFIVGMPRSGSTLVEQILASHPQVHAAGELTNLFRVVETVSDSAGRPIPFPRCVSALDADGFRRLGQAYLASLPLIAAGKTRITDKMLGNFLDVGLIHLMLPNARIIHMMRDPVDTCVSCFSKRFSTGQAFSYDLAELGAFYRCYHELMAHWRSVLPAGALLDVSYEDVVDNLEEQARRLIDYCGLPWDDRCLSFHENRRHVTTASNVQVRRPLYRSSVARWRRYEAYLQPLLAELDRCGQQRPAGPRHRVKHCRSNPVDRRSARRRRRCDRLCRSADPRTVRTRSAHRPAHSANTALGNWPQRPRRIDRFSRCGPISPRRTTTSATCSRTRASSTKRRPNTSEP